MKFEKSSDDKTTFGFEQHPIGVYAFQILEGITLKTRDDSPGKSLMIPLQSTKALKGGEGEVDGDANAVGGKLTHFIVIITKEGVEMKRAGDFINSLLTNTGIFDKMKKKFPKGVDFNDDKSLEKFIDTLKVALRKKMIKAEINQRKDQNGEMQSQVKWWTKYGKSTPEATEEEPEDQSDDAVEDSDDDDDWD